MIGYIRIADVPQLVITVIVFVILSCVFFVPLEHFPDLEKAMPGWVFIGVMLFIVTASIVAGHFIWKWLDD
jgi:hypothetical protein